MTKRTIKEYAVRTARQNGLKELTLLAKALHKAADKVDREITYYNTASTDEERRLLLMQVLQFINANVYGAIRTDWLATAMVGLMKVEE